MYVYVHIYIYIYTCEPLLGTTMAIHAICSAQGLSENMDILSATLQKTPLFTNETQVKHKVSLE